MDPDTFKKLTANQIQRYAGDLDSAAEAHSRWLAQINRTLICGTPPHPDDLAEEPHRLCHFGRWYDGVQGDALRGAAGFTELGEIHTALHQAARDILIKHGRGESTSANEYDQLVEYSQQLRARIHSLSFSCKENLNLISRLMSKVFENAGEGVIITDRDARILSVNRAFTEVTGYTPDEVAGKNANILYSGRQDEEFYREMWDELLQHGQWQGEIWNRRKNGSIYPEWLSIATVTDEQGEVTQYVGIFSDISTAKENEERLFRLAHYDLLTNLPNRMTFQDQLRRALAQARRSAKQAAVMFLDLDGFKEVNDTLGHKAGDRLLQDLALRLKECLRETDTVARFGGDEFTAVLTDLADTAAVNQIADKIIAAIARPFELPGGTGNVTTSIGISLFPKDGEDVDSLISRADAAMYHAKRDGKNHYRFHGDDGTD